jgi:hypothetical protein
MFKSGEFGGWDMSLISNLSFLAASQNNLSLGATWEGALSCYIYRLIGVFLRPLRMNRR